MANMVDLRNLETFVWVARLHKFHLAAEKLHTTQPAVSARIALLERDLGTRLFNRRPRRAELTTAGLELLGYAERMLSLHSDILQTFGNSAKITGVLRLGVPETIVHTWLSKLIEQLALDYPGVTLDIEIDSTPTLHRALMAEKLDIAFLHQPGFDQDIKCEPLCSYPLAWFASEDFPFHLSLLDIAKWPILTFRRGSPVYVAIQQLLDEHGLKHSRIFGSSAISAIVRMTQDRIGVCVLPEAVIQKELRDKSLRRLSVDCVLPALNFFVCYRKKSDNPLPDIVSGIAVKMARIYMDLAPEPSKSSIDQI